MLFALLLSVQEEVMKLTEKHLNSVGSSPVLNQLKAPDELKSNILKAQAEAARKVLNFSLATRSRFQSTPGFKHTW